MAAGWAPCEVSTLFVCIDAPSGTAFVSGATMVEIHAEEDGDGDRLWMAARERAFFPGGVFRPIDQNNKPL